MTFSGTKCDECGRIKGESNHWHQIGLDIDPAVGINGSECRVWVELGRLQGPAHEGNVTYRVLDLCGEACFYKHIGKLLKLNPTHPLESDDDA